MNSIVLQRFMVILGEFQIWYCEEITPMPKKNLLAHQITINALRVFIHHQRWTISSEQELQYDGYQIIITDGITKNPVDLFPSGKIVIQGKPGTLRDTLLVWRDQHNPLFSQAQESSQLLTEIIPFPQAQHSIRTFTGLARIGLDEAGKGDYFGPLVIGAVYLDAQSEGKLTAFRVRDSKLLSDTHILQIAEEIKELCSHEVVTISAKRYNELYNEIHNVNNLLAKGHAFALEKLLEKVPCQLAIADQFGDASYLRDALLEKSRTITLEQRTHGEEDIAVAAASILARAEFVQQMERISSRLGITLPKGASDPNIITIGREIVKKYGKDTLEKAAKLHFRTSQEII
jgi:ribonuclease HIII